MTCKTTGWLKRNCEGVQRLTCEPSRRKRKVTERGNWQWLSLALPAGADRCFTLFRGWRKTTHPPPACVLSNAGLWTDSIQASRSPGLIQAHKRQSKLSSGGENEIKKEKKKKRSTLTVCSSPEPFQASQRRSQRSGDDEVCQSRANVHSVFLHQPSLNLCLFVLLCFPLFFLLSCRLFQIVLPLPQQRQY